MVDPPPFLAAVAHPVRWRLLSSLAGGDLQVGELTAAVGQPQNLVSYHLGRLRKAGVVGSRRSNADRRDTYYTLDLAACTAMLSASGGALHPALALVPPSPPVPAGARVLFLCTGNSSRSQMAEALLRSMSGAAVTAVSAGSAPKPIHPHAIAAMAAAGLDLSEARSKHLDEFAGSRLDRVITLCDKVREVCPSFPGHPARTHWSLPDPSAEPDGYPAFARAAADIAARVRFLLHTLAGFGKGPG